MVGTDLDLRTYVFTYLRYLIYLALMFDIDVRC